MKFKLKAKNYALAAGEKDASMRTKTLIFMALKNLSYKKLRTFLTASGVVIGTGAIVFLLSFSLGLRNTVNKQVVDSQSVKTIDVTSPDATAIHINDDNLNNFEKFENVEQVAHTYVLPGTVSFDSSTGDSIVYGTDDKYLELLSPQVIAGSMEIKNEKTSDAVVNQSMLKSFGIEDAKSAIGKEIVIKVDLSQIESGDAPELEKKATITGVVASGNGSEMYIHDDFITSVYQMDYTQAKVVVNTQENVPNVRKQIESSGFITQSPLDTITQINNLFSIFAFILAGIGGVGMIIAVLGMFNTLTISLLERTSEIGLMMAIGARRKDVRKLFMFEALALSLLGGIGGIVGAWGLGAVINIALSMLADRRGLDGGISIFSVPFFLSGSAVLFVLFVGYVVVFFPARRASRINPISALKHE